MKTCDVCKKHNGPGGIPSDEFISSVTIGTSIGVYRAGAEVERTVECELCSDCIEKVNRSVAQHLHESYGLVIRC